VSVGIGVAVDLLARRLVVFAEKASDIEVGRLFGSCEGVWRARSATATGVVAKVIDRLDSLAFTNVPSLVTRLDSSNFADAL
jgi:hypothetical protein